MFKFIRGKFLAHQQFILYCLCGGMGVCTDYGIYHLILMGDPLAVQRANLLGYLGGTLVSFFLNRSVTFGMRDQVVRRLATFIGVASVGYAASALLLWLLIDTLHAEAHLAKLMTLPFVVVLQFTLNRKITFNAAAVGT